MVWISPFVALMVFAVWAQKGDDPAFERIELSSQELAMSFDRNLVSSLTQFRSYVENPDKFTIKTCASSIEPLAREAMEVRPEMFQDINLAADHAELAQKSFELRLALVKRLREFHDEGRFKGSDENCVRAVRMALRYLRHFEDFVLVSALNPKEFNDKIDPKAGKVLQGKGPELLTPDGNKIIRIRSGDVLLSRGSAYTSAAIARIGVEEGQFSHLSQIYIDAPVGTELTIAEALKDKRVRTVEAHIEIGSFTRDFASYVSDGNSRVLLYRSRVEPSKAHRAAKNIYTHIIKYQEQHRKAAHRTKTTVNDNLPYDFKMDNEDTSALFCSEIVGLGYKNVGIQLPTFPSRLRKNGMTRRMEINVVRSFAPSDMEIEAQFELLAEWRDLRKIPSVMRKDAVLSAMFKWMDTRNYDFIWNAPDAVKARFAWTVRQLDLGFDERLPKNMNRDIIAMTFVLERVANRLEDELIALQKQKFESGKMRPNFPEQMIALEKFRAADQKVHVDPNRRNGVSSEIHNSFRALTSRSK